MIFISMLLVFLGDWTVKKHQLLIRLSSQFTLSSQLFSGRNQPGFNSGDKIPYDFFNGGEYRQFALSSELIYGLDDGFEVGVKLPYYDASFTNSIEAFNSQGFPELHFFATKQLSEIGSYNFLIQSAIKINLSEFKKLVNQLNIGDQSTDVSLGLMIASSLSLFDANAYHKLSSRYTLRSSNRITETDFGNEWIVDYEAGVDVNFANIIINPSYTRQLSDIKEGIVIEDKQWLKLGGKIIRTLYDNTQMEINYYKTFSGRNAVDFSQFSIKLFHSL